MDAVWPHHSKINMTLTPAITQLEPISLPISAFFHCERYSKKHRLFVR